MGKARMQHAELGAAAVVGVARKGGMSGLATCMAAMESLPLPDRGLSLCRTVKACG